MVAEYAPLPTENNALADQARTAQRGIVERDLAPGEAVWVQACPGAGKTRVIVERHLERPLPARRGRAIVSFTRAAGRELRARSRERGRPELSGHPHFIGTLDGFIWRYLVRPYLGASAVDADGWSRLDSWEDHPEARVEGHVSLDDFKFTLSPGGVPQACMKFPKCKEYTDESVRKLEQWAAQRKAQLIRSGYLTGEELRERALRNLDDPSTAAVAARMLSGRFHELIVDEAQDCSVTDDAVLRRVNALGLPLMLVGDTGQSIYGFRDRDQGAVSGTRLADDLPRMELRHNWRSSQVICDLTATLSQGSGTDTAVGPYREDDTPILLVPRDDGDRGPRAVFRREADRLSIPRGERLVLARQWGMLPKELIGTPHAPLEPLNRLLWAIGVLRAAASPRRRREKASRILREHVLDLWCPEGGLPEEQRIRRSGLPKVGVDRAEALVLAHLPELDTPLASWVPEAAKVFHTYGPTVRGNHPPGALCWETENVGSSVGTAAEVAGAPTPGGDGVGTASSVHQAKGGEADAVLMLLAPRQGYRPGMIDHWINGREDEAARILYVAVSRARRLLTLGVPQGDLDRVARYLERNEVACRVLDG
ncbi:UvrD-helicase domain-containing protein [Nocardiopsis exhalans]|uniref:DNA 3'-5' helicase n=1 Tax=Nocardiopsis exhalans TaxID=163604 RepID=A0ABY5D3M1_9ACTN|nr:UvrD-helicase domain-containing protein [Nocardiopsis exhalans]USY17450.1 UvrD-helicase domain-containing protein [Nocardiopsis exhalans]